MSKFFFGWRDESKQKGEIFLNGIFFANVYRNHDDFGGKWVLNRDKLAMEMGLSPQPCFESPESMHDFLDKWLATS